jgi:hypothetical protein
MKGISHLRRDAINDKGVSQSANAFLFLRFSSGGYRLFYLELAAVYLSRCRTSTRRHDDRG